MRPACSLLAPCDPGASTPRMAHLFPDRPLPCVNDSRHRRTDLTRSAVRRGRTRARCGTLMWRLNAAGWSSTWRSATARQHEKHAAATGASDATMADAMEQRVVAFAEQLGRIAGTLQAKAEGWMDREALNKQIASVRDGAADLLEQLAGGATKASNKKPAAAGGARRKPKGAAAAWSTRPARSIASRCRAIRARTLRTARRPKCGRPRRWSRRTGAAGAASRQRPGSANEYTRADRHAHNAAWRVG